jgi:hypothetical protein
MQVASAINMFLGDLLLGESNDTSTVDFIIEEFSPTLTKALKETKLPLGSRLTLFNKFFGTLIKIVSVIVFHRRQQFHSHV